MYFPNLVFSHLDWKCGEISFTRTRELVEKRVVESVNFLAVSMEGVEEGGIWPHFLFCLMFII